jgi:hypothetical protein
MTLCGTPASSCASLRWVESEVLAMLAGLARDRDAVTAALDAAAKRAAELESNPKRFDARLAALDRQIRGLVDLAGAEGSKALLERVAELEAEREGVEGGTRPKRRVARAARRAGGPHARAGNALARAARLRRRERDSLAGVRARSGRWRSWSSGSRSTRRPASLTACCGCPERWARLASPTRFELVFAP